MPHHTELTDKQATDLARYYLGTAWRAERVGFATFRLVDLSSRHGDSLPYTLHDGSSWRDVFRAAGVRLPSRSRYTQQGTSVMLNGEHIAACASGTKARMVCAALNDFSGAPVPLQ